MNQCETDTVISYDNPNKNTTRIESNHHIIIRDGVRFRPCHNNTTITSSRDSPSRNFDSLDQMNPVQATEQQQPQQQQQQQAEKSIIQTQHRIHSTSRMQGRLNGADNGTHHRRTMDCLDAQDDIGFDFEESNQVITNFQDLPLHHEDISSEDDTSSADASMDSFLLGDISQMQLHAQVRVQQDRQKQESCNLKVQEPIIAHGESSTCSTAESLSDDDDDDDEQQGHDDVVDVDDNDDSVSSGGCGFGSYTCNTRQESHAKTQPMFTSTPSPTLSFKKSLPLPSSQLPSQCVSKAKPSSILLKPQQQRRQPQEQQQEKNLQVYPTIVKRSVSFSPCLVTEIHTTPRASSQEWHNCYYTAHELQRMMDEKNEENEEAEKGCTVQPLLKSTFISNHASIQYGGNLNIDSGRNRSHGRQYPHVARKNCVMITAQEEEEDLEF